MSLNTERNEIFLVVNRLCDSLSKTISSQTGREGVALRHQVGDVRTNHYAMINDGTFLDELFACFTAAEKSNVKLESLTVVHNGLFLEQPVGDTSISIVQAAISFCLSIESKLITKVEFNSRDDVEVMINRMKIAFDIARDLSADSSDSTTYQALTALAGSLINHLANISRPLPRMITFTSAVPLPALAFSQRIYYDPNRWEEIVNENKTIHPAFVQRNIRGLSF